MPAPLTDYNFLRKSSGPSSLEPEKPKPLTSSDFAFMQRMEGDIDGRRRTAFIVELKKDPRFKPSMLEPPKAKFKTVSLEGGPIVKTVKPSRTGLETKRPYKWGPLGGFF